MSMQTGPGREKCTAGHSTARRGGQVSLQMTAQDILSLAVNVAQNQWPLGECDSTAMRVMLDELYDQILEANRRAVEKRLTKRGR